MQLDDTLLATDPISVIGLVVAILGFFLSGVSLAWQAATFVWSGSQVKVALRYGARNLSSVVTFPKWPATWNVLSSQGYTVPVLAVEARNVGRLPVSVTKIEAVLESGHSLVQLEHPPERLLPYRLEPGSEQTWFIEMQNVSALISASQQVAGKELRPTRVSMRVHLGTGKAVTTGKGVIPPAARLQGQ